MVREVGRPLVIEGEPTTIRVGVKTKNRILKHELVKGEVYDSILNRVLDFYEKHHNNKKEE